MICQILQYFKSSLMLVILLVFILSVVFIKTRYEGNVKKFILYYYPENITAVFKYL